MRSILFCGDVSLDLTMAATRFPQPDEKVHCSASVEGLGGVVTNTAVAARRAGAPVSLMVRLGDDPASSVAQTLLSATGISLHIEETKGALCRVVTIVEPHGEKRLLLHPGVTIYPSREHIATTSLDNFSHVHTAVYGPAAHVLIERARMKGVSWSLDLEPATFSSGISVLEELITGASCVFVNDRSAYAIGKNAGDTLAEMGARSVLRSSGAKGAVLYDSTGSEICRVPAPPGLPIVDTTGAGDCLAGWYIAGLHRGQTQEQSLRDAVRAATMACSVLGAQSASPTYNEYQTFWREQDQ